MRYRELLTEWVVHDFNPEVNPRLFDLDAAAHGGRLDPKDKKEFARWLRDHQNDLIRMYHGTKVDHDVMGKGLLPTSGNRRLSIQSGSGYVYLAYDPRTALDFARMGHSGQYKQLVVYAVDVAIRRLKPDKDQLRNKRYYTDLEVGTTLADSLIIGRTACVKGRIEPHQIHIYGRYDHHGHPLEDD